MVCFTRQGSITTPFTYVQGPEAWYADEYRDSRKYIYALTPNDIQELDAAVAGVLKAGIDIKVRLTYRVVQARD